MVERKMTFNKLPEDTTHYWSWRVHAVAELIQHIPFETEAGRLFVEELDTSDFDELGDPIPAVLTATDSKLYGALLSAVQPHHATLVMRISTTARPGCGRQAMKIVDSENNFESAKLADAANNQIMNAICRTMSAIPDYVARTRLALQYLEGFPGAMLPEQMLCQRVAQAVEGIDDRYFLAAMADFRVKRRENRRTADLLQLLEMEAAEWKRRQEDRKGKQVLGAAAPLTRGGSGGCPLQHSTARPRRTCKRTSAFSPVGGHRWT